ncbi:MAG: threo-3-hydroxy-L-aspartate ammonia-lyase [Planctomycetota bacterium]
MPTPVPTEPDFSLVGAVTFDDVVAAAETIRAHAIRTPVMTSRTLDERVGATVQLKCESFQRVGAFKFRGACNAISRLDDDAAGVLAYSSGNHAQGVALASALLRKRAVIVMPENAPAVKLAATRGYLEQGGIEGSRVVTYDPQTTVREELGAEIAEREGLTVIPPYDHPHVIAGQGTAAMELIEDHGPLDALFVCVGGGGLLSGSAIAVKAMNPACRVIGVEPELADDAARSFRDRTLHTVRNPPTIADGARTPQMGRYTFPLVLTHVDDIITVSDDELRHEMRFCFERMKLVVEPSGVLGLAGLLRERSSFEGRRVGVIISGGNVDPASFSSIVADGIY